jgi:hypothetical protein
MTILQRRQAKLAEQLKKDSKKLNDAQQSNKKETNSGRKKSTLPTPFRITKIQLNK